VTPHVLRHSFASIASDLGFTEVTIAALVGTPRASGGDQEEAEEQHRLATYLPRRLPARLAFRLGAGCRLVIPIEQRVARSGMLVAR
jgi:hypothetical protein